MYNEIKQILCSFSPVKSL
uniref:Uncharacterized protein n=1 Tax=Anguilla anguilla TaxID=7936 RepID=A0A0E9T243_ANGAN